MTALTIDINDLPGLIGKGLKITGSNHKGDDWPELIAEIPESLMAEMNKKSKLTTILESMLQTANANPGQVQRKVLGSGLGIDLIIALDGMLRLQLWRDKDKSPSDTEWHTTLKYFPITLTDRDPERFTAKGRGYLRAAWELPK
jgi:hypothetical protein